jgi:endoplasmic reticulum lectin 1
MFHRYSWILLFCLLDTNVGDLQDIAILDDLIAYRVIFKSHNELPNDLLDKLVPITSADDEHYQCVLPEIETRPRRRIESYTGPSPGALLQPLYVENTCSFRIESYWVYELCHGRYLLQYHEEKDSKTRTEYYLGNFAKSLAEAEDKKFDQLNPPTRRFEEEELPYYPVTYQHGTTCDLTGKPRTTTVLYVCEEGAKNQIRSLNELSTCNYEIVVMTNRLCAHPSFHKAPAKENEIQCYAEKEQRNEKPRSLLSAEKEAAAEFFREFSLGSNTKATQLPLKTRQHSTLNSLDDQLGDISVLLDALKSAADQSLSDDLSTAKAHTLNLQLANDFWHGKTCIYGGSGWWQYELCYGRKVVQFHESRSGKERTEIVLGTFNEEIHRQWAEQYPHKVVKSEGGHIQQVSNMYTQGDICKETGAHRSCEVRIRCHKPTDSGSYSKILIYMLEPDTCSYILVVESALFCDGLQKMDKYGMLPEMPQLQEQDWAHSEGRTKSTSDTNAEEDSDPEETPLSTQEDDEA